MGQEGAYQLSEHFKHNIKAVKYRLPQEDAYCVKE